MIQKIRKWQIYTVPRHNVNAICNTGILLDIYRNWFWDRIVSRGLGWWIKRVSSIWSRGRHFSLSLPDRRLTLGRGPTINSNSATQGFSEKSKVDRTVKGISTILCNILKRTAFLYQSATNCGSPKLVRYNLAIWQGFSHWEWMEEKSAATRLWNSGWNLGVMIQRAG